MECSESIRCRWLLNCFFISSTMLTGDTYAHRYTHGCCLNIQEWFLLWRVPLDTFTTGLMTPLEPILSLSSIPPSVPEPASRHTPKLATQHVFSTERTHFQSSLGGFVESWGPGNLPGCVKVSMRKASRCLQKLRRREILWKA